jgi:hypothetical protein
MSSEHPSDRSWDQKPRERRERPPEPDTFNGFALASIICAVPSFILGPFAGIPALICGFVALRRPYGRTAATVGIGLSFAGMLTFALVLAYWIPKAREAAKRVQDADNLREIGFALHQRASWYNGALPRATGPSSWRSALIEHFDPIPTGARGFNTKEPWDGPVNAERARVSVPQYVSSGLPIGSIETRYLTFVGKGTASPPFNYEISLMSIRDGTSYTFYAVEATESVPWAQPKDLEYREDAPLPPLGTPGRDGFMTLLADGSVKWVKRTVSEQTLRLYITRDDGNVTPELNP